MKKLKNASIALFTGVTIITFFFLFWCSKLKFDYDFESFFPNNDADLAYYQDFRESYEYDNEFVFIGIESEQGIFNTAFLKDIRSFSDSLKKINNIKKVISPTSLSNTIISPIGFIEIPYLHVYSAELYSSDSSIIYSSPQLVGTFFAKNAKSVSVFLKTKDAISKKASDSLLFAIEHLMESYPFQKTHIVGKLKAQKVYVSKLQSEFLVFLVLSFLLVLIFLYISFRSFWGVWLPVLVVLLSIVWTLGIISITGKSLDIMMVLLPTMMFVVGMSDVVHIVSKYLEEIKEQKDKLIALKSTLKEVGFPTFITLISTAVGFLTLFTSKIKPIRDFGIYTSLGIFIAFILAFTIIPAILFLMKTPKTEKEQIKKGRLFWNKRLHSLLIKVFKYRKLIVISAVVIIVLSSIGICKISLNNYLLEDIGENDPLRQDFNFFETNYSGVRPFEMGISVLDTTQSIYDYKNLLTLDKTEYYLNHTYGVGFMLSPLAIVKATNQALNGGSQEYYRLPNDSSELSEIVGILRKNKKRKELKTLISDNEHSARISGKMKDLGSVKTKILNEQLEAFLKQNNDKGLSFRITGIANLMDKNNEYLVNNILQGIFFSILIVGLIIAFIHRSIKMVIISIIPNIVPMIIVAGIMGFTGIELKTSTSIIFSIAFGIATDDTIHFLARLKLELNKGKSLLYAIKRSYISTGKAVIVTSLILSAGFLTLISSNFQSTFYFGLLVSVILLIAVFTDLLLLPILLLWMKEKE